MTEFVKMEDLQDEPKKCEECAKKHLLVKVGEDGTVLEVVVSYEPESHL